MKNQKGYIELSTIIFVLLLVLLFGSLIIAVVGNFCLDYESGSHRIIPTAVDKDLWGNYKVYYRTTEYTKNSEEDFYYIDRNHTDLVEQMRECIKQGKEVVVYYDEYVGFKGHTAPPSSPIVKIEPLEKEEN